MQKRISFVVGDPENTIWGVSAYERPTSKDMSDVQKRRLMMGITRVVARKGYSNSTVADVLKEVKVSRKTFYELFKDKEECFIAAYKFADKNLVQAIKNGQKGARSIKERIENAHVAYLEIFHNEPEIGAAFLGGVASAGAKAIQFREQSFDQFTELYARLHAECRRRDKSIPKVPKEAFLALSGGINRLVAREILSGRASELMSMLPTILYLAYSVYGMWAYAAEVAKDIPKS